MNNSINAQFLKDLGLPVNSITIQHNMFKNLSRRQRAALIDKYVKIDARTATYIQCHATNRICHALMLTTEQLLGRVPFCPDDLQAAYDAVEWERKWREK